MTYFGDGNDRCGFRLGAGPKRIRARGGNEPSGEGASTDIVSVHGRRVFTALMRSLQDIYRNAARFCIMY
jgi:hypothetical protein